MKIAFIAEAAGLSCMVGCMEETRVGITAGTHVALALAGIKYADLDGHLGLAADIAETGVETVKGVNRVPEVPGLGVKVKEELLTKFTRP